MNKKLRKGVFVILVLQWILFSFCKTGKIHDYPLLMQNVIFKGDLKDGKSLYLICEDVIKITGYCFIDNNRAIVETAPFFVNSTGQITFTFKNNVYFGKISVNRALTVIKLTLPEIVSLGMMPQTILLNYFGKIPESIDCPEYYKNPVFEDIVAIKNIQYGTVQGYYTSKPIDYVSNDDYKQWFSEMFKTYKNSVITQKKKDIPLNLDIYQPKNNIYKTPLLVFIHGGAFIFGDKENQMQHSLTDYLVKRGYTVASINYRMGSLVTEAIDRTIYRNVQDTRAALRYLVHNKEKYSIDDKQIYLAGSSAGGIIALTTAFMDKHEIPNSIREGIFRLRKDLGGLDDSGNKLKNNFTIAGVVSLWGAVSDLQIIDNYIPALLFHGTEDDIVPYGKGLPFKKYMGDFIHNIATSVWQLYGSEPVYEHLKKMNIPVKYVPFYGCGHEVHVDPDGTLNTKMDTICIETGAFLFNNVSKRYFNYNLSGKTNVKKIDTIPVYLLSNVKNAIVQWQVEGGFIKEQTNNVIHVIWYGTNKTGTVTACITNENGASCKKTLNVKINL